MRFVARKDEQGRVIGTDILDDQGNVIQSVATPQGQQQGFEAPLPGQPLPGQESLGDFSSDAEIRSRESSARAASRASSGGPEGEDGYYAPSSQDTTEQQVAQSPAGNQAQSPAPDPYRGSANSPQRQGNERRQESLQEDVRRGRGPLRGLGARIRLGLGAVTYGVADAIDDVTDFGAAVVDTIRGREVDDNDNTLNVVGRLAQPDSTLGKVASEVVSFGVTTAATLAIPGIAAVRVGTAARTATALTRFGLGARSAAIATKAAGSIASGALAGAATDFIKAKEGEENLYNAIKGTPLESPISRFLAADTDGDSNLFMEKAKAAIGGVPLGVAFDLLGVGAKAALKNYRVAPVEVYLNGLKKAKGAPVGEQPMLMLKASEDTAVVLREAQELLRTELQKETKSSITETRKLLKGTLDGTEEQGLINAELDIPDMKLLAGDDTRPPAAIYQERLEEQMLKAEDLRTALSGVEDPDVVNDVLDELDESIFSIQDKLDELVPVSSVETGPTTLIKSPLDSIETSSRRAQLEKELADINTELPTSPKIKRELPEGTRVSENEFESGPGNTVYNNDDRGISFEVYKNMNDPTSAADVDFTVNDSIVRLDDTDPRESIKSALAVRRIFEYDISTREDGFVYKAFPEDGDDAGKSRASIYKRIGFSEPDEDGYIYGVVVNGELKPSDKSGSIPEVEADADTAAARAEIQTQLDELNTPVEPNQVSPYPEDQGAGSEVPVSSVDTPTPSDPSLDTSPGREPNIIGGKGVGRVEDFSNTPAPESLAPRQPQPYQATYKARSKTEIRRAVAVKTVENRIRPSSPSPDPVFKTDEFRSSLEGGVVGNASERFINTDKLTSSEEVKSAVQQVMASLPNFDIADNITEPDTLNAARKLVSGINTLDDEDGKALMIAYGSSVKNLQVSNVAARLMVKDLAGQVSDAVNGIDLSKAITDKTTSDMINDVDVLAKLSKLAHFTIYNKNLGKISAQGLRMRGLDISDEAVSVAMSKAEYDGMFKQADDATMSADELYGRLKSLYEDPSKKKEFDGLINSLQNAQTPDEVVNVGKIAHFMAFSRNASKLAQGLRMNNILSGSTTNATNVTSNAAMSLYVPATQLAGTILDASWHTMKGNKAALEADKVVMTQTIGQFIGLTQHVRDSYRLAAKTFRTGKNNLEQSAILDDPNALNLIQGGQGPVIDSILASQTLALRFLATGDEFFKQLNYRSFVHGKAYEMGLTQGLKGKKLRDYVTTVIDGSFAPSETTGIQGLGLDKDGLEYARFSTFQNEINSDTSLLRNGLVSTIEGLRANKIPGVPTLTSLFVPFIKTPSNVMAYTARNTPLAAVSKEWRNDIAAGGARAARAKGEFAMGSTALMGVTMLGMNGALVGRAPTDPEERALWLEEGNQEYSIKLSASKSISFKRMEPFAGHLALVADIFAANDRRHSGDEEEWQNSVMGATMLAFVSSVKNRTFFEGITQLVDVLDAATNQDDKSGKKIKKTLDDIALTMIPYSGALNEQRKARDMSLREANTLLEKFMNKIPGMSEDLPAQRSWLTGKPIQYSSNPVLNLYPTARQKNDPLIKALLKYNVALNPPNETMKDVKLNSQQLSRYNELTGTIQIEGKTLYQSLLETYESFDKQFLDAELDYIQNNDDYASKTPLAIELGKVRIKYREAADSALVQEYPDLFAKVKDVLVRQGYDKRGMYYMNDPLGSFMGYEVDESDPQFIEQKEDARQEVNKKLERLVEGPGTKRTEPLDSLQ